VLTTGGTGAMCMTCCDDTPTPSDWDCPQTMTCVLDNIGQLVNTGTDNGLVIRDGTLYIAASAVGWDCDQTLTCIAAHLDPGDFTVTGTDDDRVIAVNWAALPSQLTFTGTNGVAVVPGSDNTWTIGLDCSQPLPEPCRTQLQGATGPAGQQGSVGPRGPIGEDGRSAYQVWLDTGNTGTEEDFLSSLVGAPGPQGDTGATGATGPAGQDASLACEQLVPALQGCDIVDGTTVIWDGDGKLSAVGGTGAGIACTDVKPCLINNLSATDDLVASGDLTAVKIKPEAVRDAVTITGTGPITATKNPTTGEVVVALDCSQPLPEPCRTQLKGDPGATGAPGAAGTNGESAYEIWLDQGNTGTENDFLASLQGPVGPAGPQGNEGPPGQDASCATVISCIGSNNDGSIVVTDGLVGAAPGVTVSAGLWTTTTEWSVSSQRWYKRGGWIHCYTRFTRIAGSVILADSRGHIADVLIATINDAAWRPPVNEYFHTSTSYGMGDVSISSANGQLMLRSLGANQAIGSDVPGERSPEVFFNFSWPDRAVFPVG
jgi:hypothetical protein